MHNIHFLLLLINIIQNDFYRRFHTLIIFSTRAFTFSIFSVSNDIIEKLTFPFKFLFQGSISVESSKTIIKGNAGQFGFYRVNYDSDGWENIRILMMTNHKVTFISLHVPFQVQI